MSPVTDFRKQLEIYLFGTLVVIAILYGAWRAYPLLTGPHITINTPHDGDTVASTTFIISGKVSRVKNIWIEGRLIPIDKDGNFSEILVAQIPYTILPIQATDFYGKTIIKVLHVTPEK
jgi:hypothetical protein